MGTQSPHQRKLISKLLIAANMIASKKNPRSLQDGFIQNNEFFIQDQNHPLYGDRNHRTSFKISSRLPELLFNGPVKFLYIWKNYPDSIYPIPSFIKIR